MDDELLYNFLDTDEIVEYLQTISDAEDYILKQKRKERKKKMKPILYHQEGCGQCKMAEMLLKKENIDYESCTDIDKMKEKGITQTPVLSVDNILYFGAKGVKEWIESKR